jgi:hypothetical protein
MFDAASAARLSLTTELEQHANWYIKARSAILDDGRRQGGQARNGKPNRGAARGEVGTEAEKEDRELARAFGPQRSRALWGKRAPDKQEAVARTPERPMITGAGRAVRKARERRQ